MYKENRNFSSNNRMNLTTNMSNTDQNLESSLKAARMESFKGINYNEIKSKVLESKQQLSCEKQRPGHQFSDRNFIHKINCQSNGSSNQQNSKSNAYIQNFITPQIANNCKINQQYTISDLENNKNTILGKHIQHIRQQSLENKNELTQEIQRLKQYISKLEKKTLSRKLCIKKLYKLLEEKEKKNDKWFIDYYYEVKNQSEEVIKLFNNQIKCQQISQYIELCDKQSSLLKLEQKENQGQYQDILNYMILEKSDLINGFKKGQENFWESIQKILNIQSFEQEEFIQVLQKNQEECEFIKAENKQHVQQAFKNSEQAEKLKDNIVQQEQFNQQYQMQIQSYKNELCQVYQQKIEIEQKMQNDNQSFVEKYTKLGAQLNQQMNSKHEVSDQLKTLIQQFNTSIKDIGLEFEGRNQLYQIKIIDNIQKQEDKIISLEKNTQNYIQKHEEKIQNQIKIQKNLENQVQILKEQSNDDEKLIEELNTQIKQFNSQNQQLNILNTELIENQRNNNIQIDQQQQDIQILNNKVEDFEQQAYIIQKYIQKEDQKIVSILNNNKDILEQKLLLENNIQEKTILINNQIEQIQILNQQNNQLNVQEQEYLIQIELLQNNLNNQIQQNNDIKQNFEEQIQQIQQKIFNQEQEFQFQLQQIQNLYQTVEIEINHQNQLKIEEFLKQIKDFEDKIISNEEKIKQLTDCLLQLNTDHDNLENQIEELKQFYENEQEKCQNQQILIEEQQLQIQNLEEQNKYLDEEIKIENKNNIQINDELQKNMQNVFQLNEQIEQKNKQIQEIKQEENQINIQYNQFELELNKHKSEIIQLNQINLQNKEELLEIQKQNIENIEQREEEISKQIKDIDNLKEKNQQIQIQNEDLTKKNEDLAKNCLIENEKSQKYQISIQQLNSDINNLNDQILNQQKENQDLNVQLETLTTEQKEKQIQLEQQEIIMEDNKQEIDTQSIQIKQLNDQLISQQKVNEKDKLKLASLSGIEQIQKQEHETLLSLQSENLKTIEQQSIIQEENEKIKIQNQSLEKIFQNFKNNLENNEKEIFESQQEIALLNDNIKSYEIFLQEHFKSTDIQQIKDSITEIYSNKKNIQDKNNQALSYINFLVIILDELLLNKVSLTQQSRTELNPEDRQKLQEYYKAMGKLQEEKNIFQEIQKEEQQTCDESFNQEISSFFQDDKLSIIKEKIKIHFQSTNIKQIDDVIEDIAVLLDIKIEKNEKLQEKQEEQQEQEKQEEPEYIDIPN